MLCSRNVTSRLDERPLGAGRRIEGQFCFESRTRDEGEVQATAGSREVAGLLGMLLALALPAWAVSAYGDAAPPPLRMLAGSALLLGVPALAIMLRWVPEPPAPAGERRVAWGDLTALLRVPDCRRTIQCWFLNGIANGLPSVLFPIVVADYFGLDQQQLFLFVLRDRWGRLSR